MYDKYNWVTGEVITQDKLNHIEDGIDSCLDTDVTNISIEGKNLISGLGMPSDSYNWLTLGTSGDTYTAPANGYVCLYDFALNNNGLVILKNNTTGFQTSITATAQWGYSLFLPVRKNDIFTITWQHSWVTAMLKFYYSEGSK